MKAVVQDEYGPAEVLRLEEIPEPPITPDRARVRVRAASVNPSHWHFMKGEPYIARLQAGLRKPKVAVLGCDLAGTVEAVGDSVSGLAPGDEVFGCTFMLGFGAFAELATVPAEALSSKPGNLSFAEAAAVPLAAMTALQGLRDHGKVSSGDRVLIIGASGGVGTFAVQLAKAFGADVTGVCSAANADLVRSLGADRVIDYGGGGVAESGGEYDVILQLAGTDGPAALRRLLTPNGSLVLSSGESDGRWIGPLGRVMTASLISRFVGQRLISFTVRPNRDDLEAIARQIEAGEVRPVISQTLPLGAVPEAIERIEQGHTRGKIVIDIQVPASAGDA